MKIVYNFTRKKAFWKTNSSKKTTQSLQFLQNSPIPTTAHSAINPLNRTHLVYPLPVQLFQGRNKPRPVFNVS